MIELKITDEQIERAKERYEFGVLKGSITKGEGNLVGAIGEIVVKDYYSIRGFDVVDESTYDYDLIINTYKFDVKTKKINTPPMEYYLCSISDYNTTQECDFYVFVRINVGEQIAYLLGYLSKKDFYKKAYFKKRGELDETCHYPWYFKDDCWNILISDLAKLKDDNGNVN